MRGVKGHFKVWGPTITWRDDGAVYWERKYWRGAGLSEGKVFSSVQFSRSVVSESVTPWIAACQASLSITNSWSSLKFTSIESVMPSSLLILCRPLLLLSPIPPSIRVFSNEWRRIDFCLFDDPRILCQWCRSHQGLEYLSIIFLSCALISSKSFLLAKMCGE